MMTGGVAAVLIPLLIVGGISIYKAASVSQDLVQSRSEEVARGLASMLNVGLQEELKVVSQIAVNGAVIEAASKHAQGVRTGPEFSRAADELNILREQSANGYEAFVLGTDGKVIADSYKGAYVGINLSERDYVKAAKAGKLNIGTVVKSKRDGSPVLTFGSPIYSKSKQIVGIAGTSVNISFLLDKVASTRLGKTGVGFVVDKTGVTIAYPDKEQILKLNFMQTEGMKDFATRMIHGETGTEYYVFKGVRKMAGFAPVPLAGWSVGIAQEYNECMAPARQLILIVVAIGILLLAATVLCVFFLARGIALSIGSISNDLDEASEQVSTASSQVASASQSLAEGASEQASALEETSSSLEEMSSMTRQNADNASQAKALMTEAREIVGKVDSQMNNMVAAIQEVTKSSEETGKIIKTIDEIAFQTNLLALNAAVEAARAGEAGAGFAVVADEVRNLAMRAADAAKSTSDLIESTIVTVKNSSLLTQQTQEAFRENVSIAGKVGQLVDEIAAASSEQAQGIGQIGKAVAEMDKVVQQTAANAEESASAAEEMNAQAEQMKNYVGSLITIVNGGNGGNQRSALFEKIGPAGGNAGGLKERKMLA